MTRYLQHSSILALFLIVLAPATESLAQVRPPERGGMVKSMGQPPTFKWFGGVEVGSYRRDDNKDVVGYATLALYKDLLSPVTSIFGVWGEGYVGLRRDALDGGGRLMFVSPALRLGAGVDVNIDDNKGDFILSLMHPIRRGGLTGKGDFLRIDWIPDRGNSFNIGVTVPLGQPNMGKTRPHRDYVRREKPDPKPVPYVNADTTLNDALANVRDTAHWINRLTVPFQALLAQAGSVGPKQPATADGQHAFFGIRHERRREAEGEQ